MAKRERAPSDDLIEALLAEGKYPAEIAARLGTTIGAVKARIDALQAAVPPPMPDSAPPRAAPDPATLHPGSGVSASILLSVVLASAVIAGLGYLLLGGGSEQETGAPNAFGTVRAVIESGTRVAGPGEPWTTVVDSPLRRQHFPGVSGIRLESGIVVLDTATGAATAWALPSELDRAPWANQLSNDLRWIVSGGPGETFAYDRKLDRTLQWPQGGVRILASFGDATLFQEFHTMTGENNPQGGAFRLWRDGEPRSTRVAWPLDAPLPPFDAAVAVDNRFATIAFTRLRDIHVVRFDVVTGEFTRHWRAGLRSESDRLAGLFPSPTGFLVTVDPAIPGAEGVDLYRGEWQGAPTSVLAHHFPGAWSVSPSPNQVYFAVRYGRLEPVPAGGIAEVPSVVVFDSGFQPVARVLSATISDGPWFADGTHLALRTSRGARVLEVKRLAFGDHQLGNGDIVEAESLLPSPSTAGLALVDAAGIVHTGTSDVRGFAVRFAGAGDAVWNRDGTKVGFVLPGIPDTFNVDGRWPAPVMEAPPFPDSVNAVVFGADSCLDLFESPSSQANVLDCLPNGTPLTVVAAPGDSPDESGLVSSGVAFWTDEREEPRRTFLFVETQEGTRGWAPIDQSEWAP